ncbi:MAG TPA: VOC family protein [Acidimicrobiales bacterium]|nr:VOC family protein [Acidimicrobiales bacterium]
MSTRTSPWPAGVPCWADLMVSDVPTARAFYGSVLGWDFTDTDDEFGGYVLAQVDGVPAAGLGPLQPGSRTAWTLYLASDDADATARAVTEHGGTVVAEPRDVGPLGRMCVAIDPAGAMFGVWQGKQHIGAGVVNRPGGLTWEDLRATDPAAAQAFYAAVFGYRLDPMEDAAPDYVTFTVPGDEVPLGGMGGMFGAEGAPSHWLVYFGVADADAATRAAAGAGGTVAAEPFDTPYGRMAALADPEGTAFWVVQTDPTAGPDRSG